MKLNDTIHLPKLTDLGEFGRAEFANGIAEIRSALVDEAWFDRQPSYRDHHALDHGPSTHGRDNQNVEDPFAHRWSASDQAHQRAEHDHPQELNFDR